MNQQCETSHVKPQETREAPPIRCGESQGNPSVIQTNSRVASAARRVLGMIVCLCLFSAQTVEAGWCGRTYQTYHSYTGWNHGCSTTGCHASSNQTRITANYTGEDYVDGVMLGLVKDKQRGERFLQKAIALGLTTPDLVNAGLTGGQYGPNYLPQYARQGLGIWGSSTYNHQQGYGVAANIGTPQLDAAVGAHIVERGLTQVGALLSQAMNDANNFANRDNAQSHANKMELARMLVTVEALRSARAAPTSTSVTNTWQTVTAPDGSIKIQPTPPAAENPGSPPTNGGDQFGRSNPGGSPLGQVPDIVVTSCNQCHLAQKKILIGPSLTDSQRLEAIRRINLPTDDPDFMPKKPSAELSPEAGQAILSYLLGKK